MVGRCHGIGVKCAAIFDLIALKGHSVTFAFQSFISMLGRSYGIGVHHIGIFDLLIQ